MSITQTLTTVELDHISITRHASIEHSRIATTRNPSTEDVFPLPFNTLSAPSDGNQVTRGRIILIIAQLVAVNVFASMSSGLLTVAIPRMAVDLDLPSQLIYW